MAWSEGPLSDDRPSRRQLLQRAAIGAVALGGLPAVLAACGSAGSGSGASSPSASRPDALNPAELATLTAALGPINPAYAGKGQSWKIGAILPLSGPGASQGISMSDGLNLAVQHIKQLGGPDITVDFQDQGTLDYAKGKDAILQIAGNKIPAVVSSYGGVGGVILPTLLSDQILAIDPAGGNSGAPGRPYFWGMRPVPGISAIPLIGNYVQKKMPSVRNLGLSFFQTGATTDAGSAAIADIIAKFTPLKVTTVVHPAYGATDFSDELAALRAGNIDAVIAYEFENDAGYFLKQYAASGIGKPVFNLEAYIASIVKIAAGGYEGQYLAIDDFYTASKNPLAAVMVKDFQATYGTFGVPGASPDFYSACAYNTMTVFWRLFMDCKQAGSDPNSGTALQAALSRRLTFPSVFGGGAGTVGSLTFDPATHGLKHWPMALFQVRNGVPFRLETGDVTGQNLRLLTS
jgi:branched-chain amino acid transport system substrate-binding protein